MAARNSSTVNILGGQFSATSLLREFELEASDFSTIQIFAAEFASHGPGAILEDTGTVSGRFIDGTEFDLRFTRDPNASIVLVPEPNISLTTSALICLVLGLRRRRSGSTS